ncbi:hypothetical protein L0F63_001557 [Massospora cicadina]|nr:hypothetical protein L0F63_001557 [Massospora cicadina]
MAFNSGTSGSPRLRHGSVSSLGEGPGLVLDGPSRDASCNEGGNPATHAPATAYSHGNRGFLDREPFQHHTRVRDARDGSGILLVGFAAGTSAFGLYLLALCAKRLGHRKASFFAVSQLTYPHASVWVDFAIAIKCFGVSISYLIIIGDLMPQIMEHFGYAAACDRKLWISAFMVALVPLASLRRLDSLRYTSVVALGSVVYLVLIVAVSFLLGAGPVPWGKIWWFKVDWGLLSVLPVFVFGFTCHQNLFSIHNELVDNGVSQVTRVLTRSVGNGAVVYLTLGSLGYLSFGDDVAPNILPCTRSCHPCRACLLKVLEAFEFFKKSSTDELYAALESNDLQAEVQHRSHTLDVQLEGGAAASESDRLFFVITAGILLGSYSLALVVEKLDTVLAFVGATGSTSISFILPGIFYLKRRPRVLPLGVSRHAALRFAAYGLVVYGALVMGACLGFNLVKLAFFNVAWLSAVPLIAMPELYNYRIEAGLATIRTALPKGVNSCNGETRPPSAPLSADLYPVYGSAIEKGYR